MAWLWQATAIGWGWFVDPTQWDEAEFTTPGNQGERQRIDLLTVLDHELGHVFGYEHSQTGVMEEALPTGTRRMPAAGAIGHPALHTRAGASTLAPPWGGPSAIDLLFTPPDSALPWTKRRR